MNRNKWWFGLIIGLILPFVGYALLLSLYDWLESSGALSGQGFSPNFRQRTLGIVAICLNLIPLNFFQKQRLAQSMRGLVLATLIYAVVWFINFGMELL